MAIQQLLDGESLIGEDLTQDRERIGELGLQRFLMRITAALTTGKDRDRVIDGNRRQRLTAVHATFRPWSGQGHGDDAGPDECDIPTVTYGFIDNSHGHCVCHPFTVPRTGGQNLLISKLTLKQICKVARAAICVLTHIAS